MFEATPYRHRAYAQALLHDQRLSVPHPRLRRALPGGPPLPPARELDLREEHRRELLRPRRCARSGDSRFRGATIASPVRRTTRRRSPPAARRHGVHALRSVRPASGRRRTPRSSATSSAASCAGSSASAPGTRACKPVDRREHRRRRRRAPSADAARSRLRAGLVVGCGGGFDNTLKLGLAYDTRDFEPDPELGRLRRAHRRAIGKVHALGVRLGAPHVRASRLLQPVPEARRPRDRRTLRGTDAERRERRSSS